MTACRPSFERPCLKIVTIFQAFGANTAPKPILVSRITTGGCTSHLTLNRSVTQVSSITWRVTSLLAVLFHLKPRRRWMSCRGWLQNTELLPRRVRRRYNYYAAPGAWGLREGWALNLNVLIRSVESGVLREKKEILYSVLYSMRVTSLISVLFFICHQFVLLILHLFPRGPKQEAVI